MAPRADTQHLLKTYGVILDLVYDHGLLAPRPWRPFSSLQPILGLQGYVIEHVRTNVDRFRRRYQLRVALGQDDGNDTADLAALDNFSDSLPPPRSRLWILLPYLVALGITQLVVSLIGHRTTIQTLRDLIGLLNLNPQTISTAGDSLIRHDQRADVLVVMLIGSSALWVVFRPLMWGFHVKRLLLNEPRAIGRRRQQSELAKHAEQLDVRGAEERLCEHLGMRAPYSSRLDLWINSTILVPWLAVGIAGFATAGRGTSQGGTAAIVLGIFFLPALLRVIWLVRCGLDRQCFHDRPRRALTGGAVRTGEPIEPTALGITSS